MKEFPTFPQPETPPVGGTFEDLMKYLKEMENWKQNEESRLNRIEKYFRLVFKKEKSNEINIEALPSSIYDYNVALYENIKSVTEIIPRLVEKPRKNCAYFCSSCDLHTPLLTTNADVVDCFDFGFQLKPSELYLSIITLYRAYTKNTGDAIDNETKEALEYRRIQGHFRTDLNQKANLSTMLANELIALGVDLSSIKIKERNVVPMKEEEKHLEVIFNWKHPKEEMPKERIISFVNMDVDTFTDRLLSTFWRQKDHGFQGGGFDYFIIKSAHRSKQAIDYMRKLHNEVFRYIVDKSSVVLTGDQFGLEADATTQSNNKMKSNSRSMIETFESDRGWEQIKQPSFTIQKKVAEHLKSVGYLLPLENPPTRLRQRTYSWYMFPFIRKERD